MQRSFKRAEGRNAGARVRSLGAEAHAETGQVSVGEGEEDHEDDVPGVVGEDRGEAVARLHVAQHEERDEDEPQAHQDVKPDAVFARLQGETGLQQPLSCQPAENTTFLDRRPLSPCCVQEHFLWIRASDVNRLDGRCGY